MSAQKKNVSILHLLPFTALSKNPETTYTTALKWHVGRYVWEMSNCLQGPLSTVPTSEPKWDLAVYVCLGATNVGCCLQYGAKMFGEIKKIALQKHASIERQQIVWIKKTGGLFDDRMHWLKSLCLWCNSISVDGKIVYGTISGIQLIELQCT